jgi:hypothetical protein
VEARRRIEDGAAGHGGVHIRELTSLDADGDDSGELPDSRSSSMSSITNATRVRRSREDSTPYGDVRKTMVLA